MFSPINRMMFGLFGLFVSFFTFLLLTIAKMGGIIEWGWMVVCSPLFVLVLSGLLYRNGSKLFDNMIIRYRKGD